jgi:hypothetical protein
MDGCMDGENSSSKAVVLWIKCISALEESVGVLIREECFWRTDRPAGAAARYLIHTWVNLISRGAPPCTARGLSRARARLPQDCEYGYGITSCAICNGVGCGWVWEISIFVCSLLRCFRLCWISRSWFCVLLILMLRTRAGDVRGMRMHCKFVSLEVAGALHKCCIMSQ